MGLRADAEAREHSIGVPVLRGIMLGDVLGHEGRKQPVALPDDEMRGIRRLNDVDRVDAARIFLADALEKAFGAGALDTHGDAGKLRLERFCDLLGERQVDRGVVDDLAFFLRRLDERRRDRRGGGRAGRGLRLRRRRGEANTAAASAVPALSTPRLENVVLCMALPSCSPCPLATRGRTTGISRLRRRSLTRPITP